jgi:hypothetical protein
MDGPLSRIKLAARGVVIDGCERLDKKYESTGKTGRQASRDRDRDRDSERSEGNGDEE